MTLVRLLLSLAALAWLPAHAQFQTGNELHEMALAYLRVDSAPQWQFNVAESSKSFRYIGYLQGVMDSMDGRIFCIPVGVTTGQVATIVSRFLEARPERWHEPASLLVADALIVPYPCRR